jgi:cell division protein FtsL
MHSYSYQYETSPRKLKPEYNNKRKPSQSGTKKKTVNKKANNKQSTKKQVPKKDKKQQENISKNNHISNIRTRISIFAKCFIIFLIFFISIYRNSLITQSFAKIQDLKAEITELQKINNQLEINIQNSINTNNIEKAAKELLGMQKLSNRQIVYISLSKKDYVEPRTEEIIIEKEQNLLEKIIEKIQNMF